MFTFFVFWLLFLEAVKWLKLLFVLTFLKVFFEEKKALEEAKSFRGFLFP